MDRLVRPHRVEHVEVAGAGDAEAVEVGHWPQKFAAVLFAVVGATWPASCRLNVLMSEITAVTRRRQRGRPGRSE